MKRRGVYRSDAGPSGSPKAASSSSQAEDRGADAVSCQPAAEGPEGWLQAPLLHMLFMGRTLDSLKGC